MLTNAVMTGTTEVDSPPLNLDQMFGLAIQAIWTGTPVGSMKLQASVQSPPTQNQTSNGGPDNITQWTDISGSSVSISASAGNFMWNLDAAYYRYIRLVYVNASGSGVLNVHANIKGA